MFKIIMSGEFGWDILSGDIRNQLNEANGQDIEGDLNSPGGFISDGIETYSLFSDYKKRFPNAQMILNVLEASSFASYLMANPAFDIVTVRQNSFVMVHHPSRGLMGDHRDFARMADVLFRTTGMMSFSYSQKMNISENEIIKIMDDETYYVGGDEILRVGLADEIIGNDKVEDIAALKTRAELKMQAMKDKLYDKETSKEDFKKAVAILNTYDSNDNNNHYQKPSTKPAMKSGQNNQEEIIVKDENELKEKFPVVHESVMKAGEDAGTTKERVRVKTLMEMKAKDNFKDVPEIVQVIDNAISDGSSVEEARTEMNAVMYKVNSDPANASRMQSSSQSAPDIAGGQGQVLEPSTKSKMTAEEKAEANRVK